MNIRKAICCAAVCCVALWSVSGQAQEPFRNPALSAAERADDLIGRMTLDEKLALLSGYNDFFLHPCERLGIPAFEMADGPLGVASWGLFGRATAYPSALSLASSWNRHLASQTGAAYAEDWRARGIHLMLAPGVNIYRASKGARNFEYFGEDPLLTTEMAMAFTNAVTDGGVLPVVKHFAGNDQEFDRYSVSTEASERTLREIYLLPFEELVTRGNLKAIMSGYNLLNGQHCSENEWLDSLLHQVWHFDGMHMSDWGATHSTLEAARRGLDMEMGSNYYLIPEKIKPLLESGELSQADIDEKVRHIYKACIEMGFFDRPQKVDSLPIYSPKRNAAALAAAREGIILLKNDGLLPASPSGVRKIAVVGPTANPSVISDRRFNNSGIVYGGGGSSKVNPWYIRTALDGILAAYPDAEVLYAEGVSPRLKRNAFADAEFVAPDGARGLLASYYAAESDSSPVVRRVERKVNNEWWSNGPGDVPGLTDNFRIVWEGSVVPTRNDSLIFFTDTQGGCRLWIDGELCIDGSGSNSFFFGETKMTVDAGKPVDIRLEYLSHNSSPSEIRLGYCSVDRLDYSEAEKIASQADLVVCCIGFDGSIELESRDRPFALPYGQDGLVDAMLRANPSTAVVVFGGGGVDMSRWADSAHAILHALYPGMEGGTAIGEIVSGKVNPSAKLPFTIERRWEDSPAAGNYDETRNEKKIYYREGIFTGYRGYDRSGVEPLFPFGHGLSYTDFEYSDLKTSNKADGEVEVSFKIKNTGDIAGAEIAQVYVTDVKSRLPRPVKELKEFEKIWLEPGDTKEVTLTLTDRAFRYYDPEQGGWRVEPGEFIVRVGGNSATLPLEAKIKL